MPSRACATATTPRRSQRLRLRALLQHPPDAPTKRRASPPTTTTTTTTMTTTPTTGRKPLKNKHVRRLLFGDATTIRRRMRSKRVKTALDQLLRIFEDVRWAIASNGPTEARAVFERRAK